MGEAKLAEVDAQITRLRQRRCLLTGALAQCHLDPGRDQIISAALDWASTTPGLPPGPGDPDRPDAGFPSRSLPALRDPP
jgi:hypothetical protein